MESPSTPSFDELVDAHYQPLYRFAYSLARNESDAADLTQQTFLIWAEKGHTLRDDTKVKSWLFTSLYREFLRTRRRGVRQVEMDPEAFESYLPPVAPEVVDTLDTHLALEAIEEIDAVYRDALLLFYVEGLPYKEIATALEIPIGTVMSRLSRGKALLKKALRRNSEIETAPGASSL